MYIRGIQEETKQELAAYIDHTVLAPTATDRDMAEGCRLGRQYGTAAVYVKPHFVIEAHKMLAGTTVRVGTVIGFPHGLALTQIKAEEAEAAMDMGAVELDMVVNTGKVLDEDWKYAFFDIATVTEVVQSRDLTLTVIFENCYLEDRHKIELCSICEDLNVAYAKTSTGFGPGGATPEDVALMQKHLRKVKVKAAGGIRTASQVRRFIELGADRIGTSATADILAKAHTHDMVR